MTLNELKNLSGSPQDRKLLHALMREKKISWRDGLRVAMAWTKKPDPKKQFVEMFGGDDPKVKAQANELFGG